MDVQLLLGKLKGQTESLGNVWSGNVGMDCSSHTHPLIILFAKSVLSEVLIVNSVLRSTWLEVAH